MTSAGFSAAAVTCTRTFPAEAAKAPRGVRTIVVHRKARFAAQIARELDISETTVKTHVRAILQLVGASKRGEAVYQARARGAGER